MNCMCYFDDVFIMCEKCLIEEDSDWWREWCRFHNLTEEERDKEIREHNELREKIIEEERLNQKKIEIRIIKKKV